MSEDTTIDETGSESAAEEELSIAIRAAFDESVAEEKGEEETKIAMIGAGAKFKNVTRLYNEFMVDAGFVMAKEDKDKVVNDVLTGADVSTEESFNAAISALVDGIKGATERSAASLIRAFAKKNDIEVFKKTKASGGTRNNVISDFYNELLNNPAMTEKEASDYLHEHGSANTIRWESSHQKVRKLVNDLNEKFSKIEQEAKEAAA